MSAKVSNEFKKHKPQESVYKHKLQVKRPQVKTPSILKYEHRKDDSWERRRSPGFTFSNLVLPDPNVQGLISQLQSSLQSNASKLSAEAAACAAKDTQLQAKDVALQAEDVSLQAQIDALVAAAATEGEYTTWTIQAIYDTNVLYHNS
ncbi:unnamed protein product, partial [marine sediment metagenome]